VGHPLGTTEYRIISVTGSTVARGNLPPTSSAIDVAAVPEGTYIVQLLAPNGVVGFATFVKAPR
jgi:hypothetical protein